ncbi:hypothetical protein [Adhaeretor mobilis]|uniref:Uncharacterized protein n=1 Tax=Adhaeretor mobilis TaxID=1930276 RepID=A0A517N1T4_9BACT|nr:hypothetical protein [Adhaeretor mobilis]QDT01100.1 hypothetical protein HG15A2_44420 [Adhaeretor mobilis]
MTRFTHRLTCCCLALSLMPLPGCGNSIETGPAAYANLQSLYLVSNQRDAKKLEEVAQHIAEQRQTGEISAAEEESLVEIINDARGGNWQAANKAARALMEAQIHLNR